MTSSTLTIGQLAAHVGVTVRAIRHYHQRGLLAEPARDTSGYRRYDAQAVVDLIRIKTLSNAGVPLARIEELLNAQPEEFTEAITHIDEALRKKIRDLTQHRRRIAELAGGERLFLPAGVADILAQLRGIGVSARTVHIERDAWILVVALSPELVPPWADEKRAALADPEFRRLYLACDEAFDWEPADPRLVKLADAMVAWSAQHQPGPEQSPPEWAAGEPPAVTLMSTYIVRSSPAWRRLKELSQEKLKALAQSPEPS
jgi:DNA-binding transcriptional MerR regulator